MKSGFVSLVGRPNAGKSTLLNRFAGQKLAIVSDKPQTTRHRIQGIRQVAGEFQIVFLDTPGIHKPMHRMNQRMVDIAVDTLGDVDLVVLVVDATLRPGGGDRFVLGLLERAKATTILALNKIDLIHKPRLLPLMEYFGKAYPFAAIVPISAGTGDGVEALEAEILARLPEAQPVYPQDYLTDQTERTLAGELIREKLLRHTHDELPYSTAVVVDRFEEPTAERASTLIYASILVDQTSQKPIVLGKGGSMIKRVGMEARRDLEGLLGTGVYLDLHVKVREDWRDNERLLDELGVRGR